ncbi:MAG: hypothetical protein PHQ94_08755 [Syntrophomonas sp.]|nr:hypothetical protein [Syntrophomonas sp.]
MKTMTLPKKTFRISALLLVVCMISSVMLSGTFAKYTSTYAGKDTALVAKWDLTMTDGATEFAVSPDAAAAELDLFSHAYDTNIVDQDGADYIIAPGVDGEFVLSMTNNSDVAADITFDFEKVTGSADVPMEYSLDSGTTWVILDNLQTALNAENIQLAETGGAVTRTIQWRWAYDTAAQAGSTPALASDDASDTDLGIASADAVDADEPRTSYILNVAITATQAEPEK